MREATHVACTLEIGNNMRLYSDKRNGRPRDRRKEITNIHEIGCDDVQVVYLAQDRVQCRLL